MGTSTDAMLCFGIEIDQEFETLIEEYLLTNVCNAEKYLKDFDYDLNKMFKMYVIHKGVVEHKIDFDECKLNILTHCSDGDPMYILYLSETLTTAQRGYPAKIYNERVSTYYGIKFIDQCEKLGLNEYISNKSIGWLLSSYWG